MTLRKDGTPAKAHMKRVAIIDPMHPDRVIHGASDCKRVEDLYYRVVKDGSEDRSIANQFTPAAYVYEEDMANLVSAEFMRMKDEEKLLKDRHYKEMQALQQKYGARP